jgi:hypothetical protein
MLKKLMTAVATAPSQGLLNYPPKGVPKWSNACPNDTLVKERYVLQYRLKYKIQGWALPTISLCAHILLCLSASVAEGSTPAKKMQNDDLTPKINDL